MPKQDSMYCMAKPGVTRPEKPKTTTIEDDDFDSNDSSNSGKGENGNNGLKLWYVICNEGTVEIVEESNVGSAEELHTPFETKREAIEWAEQNYKDRKC